LHPPITFVAQGQELRGAGHCVMVGCMLNQKEIIKIFYTGSSVKRSG
jgi:hypothetical protein